MSNKPFSLTEFVLQDQKSHQATGNLTLLIEKIEYTSRIIASHIRQAGLVDILGTTGTKNTFKEEVKKIDEFSNRLLIENLQQTNCVNYLASEELEKPMLVDKNAPYSIFFDPLDGSANTDINAPIGTIFSIYHHQRELLQKGFEQVAAGYILYGTSVMFVLTTGNGVNGFTLDPEIGSYLLSHPDISMPSFGNIYSINEGESLSFPQKTQEFLSFLKQEDQATKRPYKLRYIGAMVADVHRTLLKGGIFLYPATKKNPHGKLRLLYEANPMAFLITQAGGMAVCGNQHILDLQPHHVHQQLPVVLGSKDNVELYLQYLS
ncbi:MAG TPA: class 1 fructose-bisphosphatase [Patescibacteria group bacterium]|nr:class 1 fructose-bisphosphatase [Patescibacteria group bacterium]